MNRLNKLLFAGTLVPAIALAPLTAAVAQSPDADRAPPGARTGGPGGPGQRAQPGGANGTHGGGEHTQTRSAEQQPDRGPGARPGAGQRLTDRAAEKQQEIRERLQGAHAPNGERPRDNAESQPQRTPAARTPTGTAETRPSPSPSPAAREAAEPGTRTQRPAAAPSERAAAPPAAPDRTRNGARDERRPAAPDSAATDQRRGAPASDAVRDERRGAPNDAAQRTPDQRMQNDRRDNADRGAPPRGPRDADRGGRGMTPAGAAAIGAAAGFAGGFLAATGAQRLDEVRRDRREVVEDGRTYIREPGRTIVEDGDRSFIVHDENDRFRELGYDVRRERRGRDYVDIVDRPGGVQIVTYTDADGRMLRRVRRDRDGREFVLIDNGVDGRIRPYQDDVVDLPPPPMRLPRDRYIVDYRAADEGLLYDTLTAPPLARPPQRYTLDQIRYSPEVRSYVRSVDINTINFDSGSWVVPGSATGKLQDLASAIKRAVDRNPNSVFLVEGYTDATGNPTDNLSLSDRRAQSVAAILTKSFDVPPENLTTQGYGQQNLKVDTQGPSVENRRVVVQNITQLLASGDRPAPQE